MEATLLSTLLLLGPAPLPTGKFITPFGEHIGVGSYPVNQVVTPDQKFLVVTTIGYRQFLTVVRTSDGQVAAQIEFNGNEGGSKQGLYYGLAFEPESRLLYVSYGARDQIGVWKLGEDGTLTKAREPLAVPRPEGAFTKSNPAGLALTTDGHKLIVVNNQTSHTSDYLGTVSVINTATGIEEKRIRTGGFPFSIALRKHGEAANQAAYVGSERDGEVDILDLNRGLVKGTIKTGAAPTALLLDRNESRLFVANAGSDTVAIVNTSSRKVTGEVLLRPADMRGLPGCQPIGLVLSPDERTLYVSLSDMNCLAVVDVVKRQLKGYIPTGWLPTSVSRIGDRLFVTSAKGVQAQNPNNKDVGTKGKYIQNIIEGSLSIFPAPTKASLTRHTQQVVQNNRIRPGLTRATHPEFKNPGIKYVIYVIKENRTYDNVLADLPQGNGDPSICLFPRAITPNQHALAERFVLLDNFHVCAEVSQDGWVWSTAGMINAYGSRNTPYNYSGRGRSYDTEGSNNGIPVDLIDLPDVTRPPSGYIWEHCIKHGVSFRNYGFFTQFIDSLDKRHDVFRTAVDNQPAKKALQGRTDTNFRRYDLSYADSEIYVKNNFFWPQQRKEFGEHKAPSRFSAWKREFDQFCAKGEMPRFQMIRFGQDHTNGTRAGFPIPQSMVADNDYAVGQLVEAISHSKFWKQTAICILEDDAQAGYDHVDAHRSTAYVISPWIKPGIVDSKFYNTDSMLRTMELLLGMPPMSQYDAVASPLNLFLGDGSNSAPFTAIMPDKEIVCKVNTPTAYRSSDSAKIPLYVEESAVDEDLNDILWGAIKGPNVPRPVVRRGFKVGLDRDED